MSDDAELIRNLVRRGHRTSGGRQLVARWRPVAELQPGDVLAAMVAGRERDRATAELERALKAHTYATVADVRRAEVTTELDLVTRMGSRFTRDWRNSASLPVLQLVSTSENL